MTTRSNPTITPGMSSVMRRLHRRRIALMAATAAIVLAAASTSAALYLTRSTPMLVAAPCASCVSWGNNFPRADSAVTTLESKIGAENRTVTRQGNFNVTIALLMPLTYSADSDETLSRMADQLRAAYLAQRSINSASGAVPVRLLLANEGTSAEELAGPAARQLIYMEKSIRLVAVVGMGVSVASTEKVATKLGHDGLPMFGAVTSADDFNAATYTGLDQVVPDDHAQVAALKAAIPAPSDAVLVYDQQATDIYTTNVKHDLSAVFSKSLTGVAQPFIPGLDTDQDFLKIADDACYTDAQAPDVFYAGRYTVLQGLIRQFQDDTHCQGKTVTIVTDGDADGLPLSTTDPSSTGVRVNVIFPDDFNVSKLSHQFLSAYQEQFSSSEGLTDTWMVGTYNAMEAAWTAIKYGYEARQSEGEPGLPTKANVFQESTSLNGEYAPTGATGFFSLDNNGVLLHPDVPVYEDSNGSQRTLRG